MVSRSVQETRRSSSSRTKRFVDSSVSVPSGCLLPERCRPGERADLRLTVRLELATPSGRLASCQPMRTLIAVLAVALPACAQHADGPVATTRAFLSAVKRGECQTAWT